MSENIIVLIITKVAEMFGKFLDWIFSKPKKEQNAIEETKTNQTEEAPACVYGANYLEQSLLCHYLFNQMSELMNHIEIKFSLENKAKALIFKDILRNKIRIFDSGLKEVAKAVDVNPSMSEQELCDLHIQIFNKCVEQYTNYYFNDNYTPDEKRALSIVMPKFNRWHFPRIQFTQESIVRICRCIFYADAKVKCSATFDMYAAAFIDTVLDAESTLSELNGDLKGLTFRGVKF